MAESLSLPSKTVRFPCDYGQVYGQVCHSKLLIYNNFNGLQRLHNKSYCLHQHSQYIRVQTGTPATV